MVSVRKISGFLCFWAFLAAPVWAQEEVDSPVFEVDQELSRVFIYVRRAGLMRRAGHDHVMASEHVSGHVVFAPEGHASAELSLPLADLVVDGPENRERFDLDPDVSESSIRGTRRNMLEKVLDTEAHPAVTVTAIAADIEADQVVLEVAIELQGASAVYNVPVELRIDSGTLEVSGEFAVRHSDFGMRPFRAAAGLLRVADEIDIHFEIEARLRTH